MCIMRTLLYYEHLINVYYENSVILWDLINVYYENSVILWDTNNSGELSCWFSSTPII